MDFGKYAVVSPVKYSFEKEPDWWWIIKPAKVDDEISMARWMASAQNMEPQPVWLEAAIKEIVLLYGGTNVADEEGEPVLSDEASETEIEAVLRAMPIEMLTELWKALGEANPLWGPPIPRQE